MYVSLFNLSHFIYFEKSNRYTLTMVFVDLFCPVNDNLLLDYSTSLISVTVTKHPNRKHLTFTVAHNHEL